MKVSVSVNKDKGKGVSDVMTRYLVRVCPARGAH